jgi:hypothetical protein
MACENYVGALVDEIPSTKFAWLPATLTVDRAIRIFLKWIDDNPEYLNSYPASVMVAAALTDAFPCPKK